MFHLRSRARRSDGPCRRRRYSGFTLLEIMIASTLFGLVTAGVLAVFLQALMIFQYDSGVLLVNRDLRKITAELAETAAYATEFRIYSDTTQFNHQGGNAITGTAISSVGGSGNCLVLIYKNISINGGTGVGGGDISGQAITRIVIYYCRTIPGPLRRIDLDLSAWSGLPVEQLIPEIGTADDSYAVVVPNVQGSFSGGLFSWLMNRSVAIHGVVARSGGMVGTKNATARSECWFVVSPRG